MLLVLSAVLTGLFLLTKDQLLMWFGASEATFSYANTYVTIYTAGTFFALISGGLNSFLIAQGFSGLGMATVVLGAVLNIILDPVFIFFIWVLPVQPLLRSSLRWHPAHLCCCLFAAIKCLFVWAGADFKQA